MSEFHRVETVVGNGQCYVRRYLTDSREAVELADLLKDAEGLPVTVTPVGADEVAGALNALLDQTQDDRLASAITSSREDSRS